MKLFMRYLVVLIVTVVGIGLGWIAISYPSVATEYSCKGRFYDADNRNERDSGRLRIENYRWWVSIWNPRTDGLVEFASQHLGHFFSSKVRNGRSGHFAMYMNLDNDKRLSFRWATGHLTIEEEGKHFSGICQLVSGVD